MVCGCGMTCSNEDCGRSRRPGIEDQRWSHRSDTQWPGDREVGWHCVRSAPCTWRQEAWVSWLSLKTKVDGLLVVWPQNTQTVFSCLASKPVVTVFSGLASKPVGRVYRFGSQNWQMRFCDLGLKITVAVSWFGPQNHADFDFSVVSQNRRREDNAGYVSRSGSLFHLKASRARVSQSDLKTGGGVTAGGARGTITEVASGSS
jgi:hypothetical protein